MSEFPQRVWAVSERRRSHVAKTGVINGFVILEESGIAKGIRRIIAVTGHEAREVAQQATALTTRLSQIEGMVSKQKETALKEFNVVRVLPRNY